MHQNRTWERKNKTAWHGAGARVPFIWGALQQTRKAPLRGVFGNFLSPLLSLE